MVGVGYLMVKMRVETWLFDGSSSVYSLAALLVRSIRLGGSSLDPPTKRSAGGGYPPPALWLYGLGAKA